MGTAWLRKPGFIRATGLILGPLAFLVILLLPCPEGLAPVGQRVLATTLWTAIWWMTEAVPINAAGFLPFLLFPMLGVMTATETAKAGMSDSIYLFAGGFFLAAALEKWGLHRRLALGTLRILGTRPRRLVLGVMVIVAFLSFWLTNTATTVMMIPILLAVVEQAKETLDDEADLHRFGTALLLGCALAANIGGMGTPVGTVPNAVMIGQMRAAGVQISFTEWMWEAIPIVLVLLPLAWWVLVRWTAPVPAHIQIGNSQVVRDQLRALGRWSSAEKRVGMVFFLAVVLWMTRQDLRLGDTFVIPGWAGALEWMRLVPEGAARGISDGTVSVLAAILLFAVPSGVGSSRLLDWDRASRVPWGVLFLLAGGFILAKGFTLGGNESLGNFLGDELKGAREYPLILQLVGIAIVVSFLTEFASNTATCTLVIPLVIGLIAPTGKSFLPHAYTAALAASCSFMMPVATPPNALVFSTNRIPIGTMIRNGLVLNVLAACLMALIIGLRS